VLVDAFKWFTDPNPISTGEPPPPR
jgi:hypothetical protein